MTGDWPWGLTLLRSLAWWVGPCFQWVRPGLSRMETQNASPKHNTENHQVAALLLCLGVPPLWTSQATGAVSQGASVVGISMGLPEMLQKSDHQETKHHIWRVGELKFIKPVVLDKLTLWCLEAQAQDEFYSYRVSTHNYSWHQLIGYLVAMDLGQLQSTGVAMG